MKGDREYRDDDESVGEDFGPLLGMVRLNPPPVKPGDFGTPVPAFVERYDRTVVLRHVFPEDQGDSLTEQRYATDADAVRGMAHRIGFLRGRGYTVVDESQVATREGR